MLNPFSSTNTNIFDERTHNTTPANLCGQNVLVSQEQHRKIFNTLTTSITGMPGTMQPSFHNPNVVTFTFKPNQDYYPQNYWCCQTPAMQNLNQLQQQTAADLLQLQRQLNQPYQCKFHLDSQTSTTDLGAKPGSICDQIDQEEHKAKKVNFECAEGTKNAEVQVECKCPTCPGQEAPARVKKKRRRSRKKSPTTTSDESTDNESDNRNLEFVTQLLYYVANSRSKLEVIYQRLMNCKMAQDTLDSLLSCIQNNQNKWEEILQSFENKCYCNEIIDENRACIYKLADNLFATLSNHYEMLDSIESKATDCYVKNKEEPIYLLFQIMDMNLNMLDKINIHIEKLKNRVDFYKNIWAECNKRCTWT
ncbi:hypothetical protein TcasGA2_TC012450 [Tribolium castaneum]|uniref:Uncharacterized protein n=2 Tax=Tribolium castaneum TaxID=7070 RepID=A0A139WCG5_TRICA|nr:hypothetical protein TcasGA2_TC012450 [Tribolium castaneum]